MADIKYIISVDEKGAIKAIQSFDKALDDVKKTTENKTKPALDSLWKQFAIGSLVADELKKGIDFLKGSIGGIFTEAVAAEEAQNRLSVALDTSGRSVDAMLPGMVNFAQKMMMATTRTDEEVLSAQALLVQLTNLDRDGLDRATEGSIGLAYVMKTDLQSAATTIAKAYEGNFQALQRIMPKLKEAKTESEKMAVVNSELAKYYKSATGETNTFGGALKQLKNMWGEVQEAVGTAIIENDKIREIIGDIKEALIDFVASGKAAEMGQNIIDALQGVINFIKNDFLPGLGFVAKGVQFVIDEMKNTSSILKGHGITSKEVLTGIAKNLRDLGGDTGDYEIELARLNIDLRNHDLTLKDLLIPQKKVKDQIDETGNAGKRAGQAIKTQLLPPFRDLKNVVAGFNLLAFLGGLQDMPGYFNAVLPPARDMSKVLKEVLGEIKLVSVYSKKSFDAMVENWQASMDKIKGAWDILHTGLTNVFDQAQRNREIALDNEYKKRLAIINATITDEGERQKAIEALEAEYQIKRTSAQRAAAKSAKAVALMGAIVNVAEGVAKALSAAPPPWNIALAAITAALGAIQIALIRAQPIPLAKGAIFRKPTKLFSQSGASYEVGEGGEPEVLAPLSKLPGMGRSGAPIYLTVPIYIGTEKIEERVIKIVNRSIGLKRIKAYAT